MICIRIRACVYTFIMYRIPPSFNFHIRLTIRFGVRFLIFFPKPIMWLEIEFHIIPLPFLSAQFFFRQRRHITKTFCYYYVCMLSHIIACMVGVSPFCKLWNSMVKRLKCFALPKTIKLPYLRENRQIHKHFCKKVISPYQRQFHLTSRNKTHSPKWSHSLEIS